MCTLLMKGDRETAYYHFFFPPKLRWILETGISLFPGQHSLSLEFSHGVLVCWTNIFQQNSSRPDAHLQPQAWILCFAPMGNKLVTENRETPWMLLKIAIRVRRFDWPAVAYLHLSVWHLSPSKLMTYLDFRVFSVVSYVQSTTVSVCKTSWMRF